MNITTRLLRWTWRAGRRVTTHRLIRAGSRTAVTTALNVGRQSAIDAALGAAADTLPFTASTAYTQVFNVKSPVTVYVRGSHCRVTVQRDDISQVILEATMARAFGLEFVTDQDDAGVYIVARRKPVTGKLARAEFTITAPHDSHLVFNLTPGDVILHHIDGMLELPNC
ncbi:MAG: hypothetical protein JXQ72_01045 [Anaerolineae bacterium]|nr:hypothetical protein [Anaerolineae bacterium]